MKTGLLILSVCAVAGCAQWPILGHSTRAAAAAQPASTPRTTTPAPATWAFALQTGETPSTRLFMDAALLDLQARALQANLGLQQAAMRVAQARRNLSLSDQRPNVSANAQLGSGGPLDGGSWRSTRSVGLGAQLSYEVDLWGRLAQLKQLDRNSLEATEADLATAQANLRIQVAQAYWQLAALELKRPATARQLTLQASLLRVTQLRVAEGKLPAVEFSRAQQALELQQRAALDEARDETEQRLALAALLGQATPWSMQTVPALPAGLPPTWYPGEPGPTLERRPDVRAAVRAVDAALIRLGIAEAQRYPSLVFSASANTGGNRVSEWLSNPVGALSAALAVPLVDFRRMQAAQANARTDLDVAALALRSAVIVAAQDIERAWLASERLAQQWRNARIQREQAADQLNRTRLQFDNGTVARADLQQAESALLRADTDLEQLRARLWLARLDQLRAVAAE
jgi:outer membrane protein TolC